MTNKFLRTKENNLVGVNGNDIKILKTVALETKFTNAVILSHIVSVVADAKSRNSEGFKSTVKVEKVVTFDDKTLKFNSPEVIEKGLKDLIGWIGQPSNRIKDISIYGDIVTDELINSIVKDEEKVKEYTGMIDNLRAYPKFRPGVNYGKICMLISAINLLDRFKAYATNKDVESFARCLADRVMVALMNKADLRGEHKLYDEVANFIFCNLELLKHAVDHKLYQEVQILLSTWDRSYIKCLENKTVYTEYCGSDKSDVEYFKERVVNAKMAYTINNLVEDLEYEYDMEADDVRDVVGSEIYDELEALTFVNKINWSQVEPGNEQYDHILNNFTDAIKRAHGNKPDVRNQLSNYDEDIVDYLEELKYEVMSIINDNAEARKSPKISMSYADLGIAITDIFRKHIASEELGFLIGYVSKVIEFDKEANVKNELNVMEDISKAHEYLIYVRDSFNEFNLGNINVLKKFFIAFDLLTKHIGYVNITDEADKRSVCRQKECSPSIIDIFENTYAVEDYINDALDDMLRVFRRRVIIENFEELN